jgi:GT2 family glycosyltransferase
MRIQFILRRNHLQLFFKQDDRHRKGRQGYPHLSGPHKKNPHVLPRNLHKTFDLIRNFFAELSELKARGCLLRKKSEERASMILFPFWVEEAIFRCSVLCALLYIFQNGKKMTDAQQTQKLSIGVLLVNYRQWELTEKCVNSLLLSTGVQLVIGLVDNNSPGPVPPWVENTPQVTFRRNKENTGLTAGNNSAYEMVSSFGVDYVMILNNDTEVAPDALNLLAGYLETHSEVGIAVPAIPYASKIDTIWSAGGKYSFWRMRLKQKFAKISDLPDHPVEMVQATGCAMMMRRKDYKRAGMQDADLFVYYEDTDLCFRVRKLGLGIQLIPEAIVLHHVSISVGGVYSPFAVYFTHRNRYIIASRHLDPLTFTWFLLYYFSVTLLKTAVYPVRHHGNLVFWMWLGLVHGLNNRPDIRPEGLFS